MSTVNYEIKLEKGQVWRIHPSEAFQGIESDLVKIIDIQPADQIETLDLEDYKHGYDMSNPAEAKDFNETYVETLWVVYHYTSEPEYVRQHFPLALFVDHVTAY